MNKRLENILELLQAETPLSQEYKDFIQANVDEIKNLLPKNLIPLMPFINSQGTSTSWTQQFQCQIRGLRPSQSIHEEKLANLETRRSQLLKALDQIIKEIKITQSILAKTPDIIQQSEQAMKRIKFASVQYNRFRISWTRCNRPSSANIVSSLLHFIL